MSNNLIDLTGNVHAIEKSNIATGTRSGYYNRLIALTIWCFDLRSYSDLIQPHFMERLTQAHQKDLTEPRYRKRKRKYLRVEILSILRGMKRGHPESSPLRLVVDENDPNQRILSYDDIVSFMETFKKKEKVNKKLARRFQKAVAKLTPDDTEDVQDPITLLDDEEEDDGEIWVLVRQESPTYDNIRSAVRQLYTATGADFPSKLQNSISLYIKGSKRLNKLAKQILGLDLSEGKKCMTKNIYSKLCYILFRSDQVEHIFAHLFFVLDW